MQHKAQYFAGLFTAVVIGVTAASAHAEPTAANTPSLTPPPPASATASDVTVWRTSYINETGLMPLGATSAAIEYAVGGSFSITSAQTVRGWMRWEQFSPVSSPQGVSRSTMQLMEADCQNGRGRLLAVDVYPYNNLQGAPRHVDAQDPQWSYPRPGDVLEQNIAMMCSAAKSVVTAALMQARAGQGLAPGSPQASTASLASAR